MKHMKKLIYAAIFIVAAILFLPLPGTTEIRNVPLLIVFHIFIFTRLTIKIVKKIKLFNRTRTVLKEKGYEIAEGTPFDIIAKKDGVTYNVKPIIRKDANMNVLAKKFKWAENAKKLIVMDKLPASLENGERGAEGSAVYDCEGFCEFLKNG